MERGPTRLGSTEGRVGASLEKESTDVRLVVDAGGLLGRIRGNWSQVIGRGFGYGCEGKGETTLLRYPAG